MADFIIVLAVAILGLLAQAAGGKRVRRLVTVTATPIGTGEPAAHQSNRSSSDAASDSVIGDFTRPAESGRSDDIPKVKSETQVEAEDKLESTVNKIADDSEESKSEIKPEPVPVIEEAQAGYEPVALITELQSEVKSDTAESATEEVKTENTPTVAAHVVDRTNEVKPAFERVDEAADAITLKEVKPNFERVDEAADVITPPTQPELVAATSATAAAAAAPPIVREEFVMTRKPGIEYFLRIVIFLWFIGLSLYYYIANSGLAPTELFADPWVMQVTFVTCALTGLGLIKGFRTILSYMLSAVDCIFDIKFLKAAAKNWTTLKPVFAADRVFMPTSIPHMVGLFIYVQTMFYLLAAMTPKSDFQLPGMPIPLPLPLDQLFSYNGLGLVMLAFCGCGILVTRQFKEVMRRLALVKPTPPQIMIGLGLVCMSFLYDYFWSIYTHGQGLGLDSKLAGYNGGTFTATGGFTGALVLAIATAVFAGVGEETLIRGALQPVFGLVPAAILHGVLHAQFQHAPIFIIQVAGWSILMGIAKRYTNTTTTIIGHAGFNFVTSFLFAFNPPDF